MIKGIIILSIIIISLFTFLFEDKMEIKYISETPNPKEFCRYDLSGDEYQCKLYGHISGCKVLRPFYCNNFDGKYELSEEELKEVELKIKKLVEINNDLYNCINNKYENDCESKNIKQIELGKKIYRDLMVEVK